jgi:PEP-CTERM motif-containing protein
VRIAKVLALTLAMGLAPGAGAVPWMEVGDAGDLPATAQVPTGSGPLTSIFGTILLTGGTDADMYRIHISMPSAFSATTVGTVGLPGVQLQSSQLFLFDAAGFGVYGRHHNAGTFRTTLPAGSPLGPQLAGDYFLAISGFGRDPVSASGPIFPSTPPDMLFGSTGPGGAQPISGWTGLEGFASRGNYRIDLTGAEFAAIETPVPEPGTLLLLAGGLFGLAVQRRCRFF